MYEQDALMCTEDGNIFIWAGATVGGGTRVNWYAASLFDSECLKDGMPSGMQLALTCSTCCNIQRCYWEVRDVRDGPYNREISICTSNSYPFNKQCITDGFRAC